MCINRKQNRNQRLQVEAVQMCSCQRLRPIDAHSCSTGVSMQASAVSISSLDAGFSQEIK